jgi:hypothetical protein
MMWASFYIAVRYRTPRATTGERASTTAVEEGRLVLSTTPR